MQTSSDYKPLSQCNTGYVLFVFSGCPAGVRWTEDKEVGHFIYTGLLRRVTPLFPGIARSRETGRDRGKTGLSGVVTRYK